MRQVAVLFNITVKHFFMKWSKHSNLVMQFSHDGDGDGTNFKLPYLVAYIHGPNYCHEDNCDLLDGSGWAETLTQADIASSGTSEGLVHVSHVA